MTKRWNQILAGGLIGLFLVGCSFLTTRTPHQGDESLPQMHAAASGLRPGVTGVTVDEIQGAHATISWHSPWQGNSVVLFGQTPLLMPTNAGMTTETPGQQAELIGLTPGTRYFFQVETHTWLGVARSPVCSFLAR